MFCPQQRAVIEVRTFGNMCCDLAGPSALDEKCATFPSAMSPKAALPFMSSGEFHWKQVDDAM